jgi:hypothetical protein
MLMRAALTPRGACGTRRFFEESEDRIQNLEFCVLQFGFVLVFLVGFFFAFAEEFQ